MSNSQIKLLLFLAIFTVCAFPLAAAFYLVDDALQRSLNLGFNPQVVRALDLGAQDLKTLNTLDPAHEAQYRARFDEIQNLKQIYGQPQFVKGNILGSLKIYFGAGLATAVLVSVLVAALLAQRITRSYKLTFDELLGHRERVRYLEEMSSWQEMAKMLAHEIKNPLTPIEVMVTSLAKAHLSQSRQEFQEHLRHTQVMVEEEIGHLKHTVNRFGDFARLAPAVLAEQDPVRVMEEHLPAVMARFTLANVSIQRRVSPTRVMARIDSGLLRQVLMNLIGNGVEANPGQNVAFTIHVSEARETIWITVVNNGVPVPRHLAARIFDPYISGKADSDNMGLGLAIVRKIMIEHGGEITYDESEGRPRFTLSLPRVS